MNNKRIFLFGQNGQVGSNLYSKLISEGYQVKVFNGRINEKGYCEGDEKYFDYWKSADIIINCIANSNTRECQNYFNGTYAVNALFPIIQATGIDANILLNSKDQKFLHISTGCIFDGNLKPHFEDSTPTPLINYSLQKYQAESIYHIHNNTIIIRPRMVFSDKNVKSNLIWKINNFNELIEENNSMTCVEDLTNVIVRFCKDDVKRGIFNCCNEGMLSPMDIKKMIRDIKGKTEPIFTISKEYLHKKIGLKLTNTWIDSHELNKYYKMPSVIDRMEEMIRKADWL
jgi:dTDP-4-dehydrorhamnose reductase